MSDLSDADVYAYAPTGLIQILCMRMPMDAWMQVILRMKVICLWLCCL